VGVGVARYERFVVYGAVWAKAEVDGLLMDVAVVMVSMVGLVGTVDGRVVWQVGGAAWLSLNHDQSDIKCRCNVL